MKKHIEYSLIGISVVLLMLITFFPQVSNAEDWIYDGVHTERIQSFSVYPSERYFYNLTGGGYPEENYTVIEVIKGNVTSDIVGIFGNLYMGNITSGEMYLKIKMSNIAYWSESFGYSAVTPLFIPIDENGQVSEEILKNSTQTFELMWSSYRISFEHNRTYPNKYSIVYWNETYNNAYFFENYSSDGILKKMEMHKIAYPPANMTLISEPSQLSPNYEISTESGILKVNSTVIKLNMTIADIDSNNDGEVDNDYLFRILNSTGWTEWMEPSGFIICSLNSSKAGNYTIFTEVKNMYGTTQQQIEITYNPLHSKNGGISGYPIILLLLFIPFGALVIIFKIKKKLN